MIAPQETLGVCDEVLTGSVGSRRALVGRILYTRLREEGLVGAG